jgi:ABC-type multidrug transport system fused ATPase/permease subunit
MEAAGIYGHIHYLLKVAFKILLDIVYLSQLLGVKSILIGAVTAIALSPISTKLSNKHGALRRDLLKSHDSLSKLISEALTGLRQIRLSSMEQVWQKRLFNARFHELDKMWKAGVALAAFTFVANLGPILLASLALSVYAYDTGRLSASVAFFSLNLFGNLYTAFQELPSRVAEVKVSWTSCQRIQRFLEGPEQTNTSHSSGEIRFENATLSWPAESDTSAFSLCNVNVTFPKGKLSVVTGKTGAGKSLLLAAILDEAKRESGRLFKPDFDTTAEKVDRILAGMTALVSQPPWIENSTVQDNILFGYPYHKERYQKVLHACALTKDLEILPNGDQTDAGLNGAVLSGGQKWRVALARAIYSPAEILVFEDILSAVDAPVAKRICNNVLTGKLAEGRTIILATHQPTLCLAAASYLVTIQGGTATGSKPDLMKIHADETTSTVEAPISKVEQTQSATLATNDTKPPKPIKRNQTASGTVGQVLSAYVSATGGITHILTGILVTLVYRMVSECNSWWLAHWTANQDATTSISYNIAVYMTLSIGSGVALTAKTLVLRKLSIATSMMLFQGMIQAVFCAPLSWIDSMPLGEMLQTLENDMYSLDYRVTDHLNNLLGNVLHLLFIISTRYASNLGQISQVKLTL